MQLFDKALCKFIFCVVDDVVYTTEMVHSLHDIIYVDSLICNPNGIRLKDIPRLIVSQFAAFDMIGIIG